MTWCGRLTGRVQFQENPGKSPPVSSCNVGCVLHTHTHTHTHTRTPLCNLSSSLRLSSPVGQPTNHIPPSSFPQEASPLDLLTTFPNHPTSLRRLPWKPNMNKTAVATVMMMMMMKMILGTTVPIMLSAERRFILPSFFPSFFFLLVFQQCRASPPWSHPAGHVVATVT